ncbi:MAG: ribosome maturation factor RimP [Christensenellales bacterium]|nr:ribosome maturation factor RimP [Christensenellaceae bacterium]
MKQRQKPKEKLNSIAKTLADTMGYELVEAAFEKEHAGVYLRIYLDKPGGITLDDCERYHLAVASKVEEFNYDYLEVCSPGVDRPIKTVRDAANVIGKTVEVKLYKALDGKKAFQAILIKLDDEGYHLMLSGEELTIPHSNMALCRRYFTEEELNKALEQDTNQMEEI